MGAFYGGNGSTDVGLVRSKPEFRVMDAELVFVDDAGYSPESTDNFDVGLESLIALKSSRNGRLALRENDVSRIEANRGPLGYGALQHLAEAVHLDRRLRRVLPFREILGHVGFVCRERVTEVFHGIAQSHSHHHHWFTEGTLWGLAHATGRLDQNKFWGFEQDDSTAQPYRSTFGQFELLSGGLNCDQAGVGLSLSGSSGLTRIDQGKIENDETTKSSDARDGGYPIQGSRDPYLPFPCAPLYGAPLLFIGGWLNARGIERGPFILLMAGWFMMVASGLCFLAFIVPFLAGLLARAM